MAKSIKTNAILNGIRQSLSIIFPLITFPYVSRVLGSEEYGKYSFAASIVNYFSLFAAFGISNYAVREGARIRDNKKSVQELGSKLFSFNIITSSIAYIGIYILIGFNTALSEYAILIIIQSLSIIMTTIGLDWINIIYEDYFFITIRYIAIHIIAMILIFILVKQPDDVVIYCLILVCASYGGNLINIIYIRKYIHVRLCFKFDKYDIKNLFVPLLILFINSLATVIYVNSDVTILGIYENNSEVGVYSFSTRIYNTIKQFINAVLMVTVPRLAYQKEHKNNNYIFFVRKLFNGVILIIFPVSVGLYMMADSIILIAGGDEYILGVNVLKILCVALIFALISSIFTNCILIINRLERKCLIATVCSAGFNLIFNFILIPRLGLIGAAVTTVIAEVINLVIQIVLTKKELDIKITPDTQVIIMTSINCITIVSICIWVNRIIISTNIIYIGLKILIAFVISISICVITYFFITTQIIYHS